MPSVCTYITLKKDCNHMYPNRKCDFLGERIFNVFTIHFIIFIYNNSFLLNNTFIFVFSKFSISHTFL